MKKGKCEITQNYNDNHKAIDLVGENYTLDDIVAHSDGVIEDIQDGYENLKGSSGAVAYGNYIKINHKNGYYTLYAHLQKGINLQKGTSIKKGEIIGYMGDSGNAYGKHLHFEVFKENEKINPLTYLNSNLPNSILPEETNSKLKYSSGQIVKIKEVYISSDSNESLIPIITEGKITRIIEDARNPYLLDNGKIGWVNNESIITNKKETYLSNKSYKGFSLVDALKQINIDSSYKNREKIANINGIQNYKGTSVQNITMLNLLKQGKLKSN